MAADLDTYAVEFDFEEMEIDQYTTMLEFAEGMSGNNVAAGVRAIMQMRDLLVPFVVRKDGTPLSDGEAAAFVGHLSMRQLKNVFTSLGDSAVPNEIGSVS